MFYFLILAAAAARFLPHPPNVACIGAIGLLAGCQMRGWRAYLIPAVVLLISDLVGSLFAVPGLGFYSPVAMAAVYSGATASVLSGRWIDGGRWGVRVPAGSVAASTVFFLVSNAGVALSGWYPLTVGGLAACYTAAIPFYGLTLIGDLCFSTLLFGIMALSTDRMTMFRQSRRGWKTVAANACV